MAGIPGALNAAGTGQEDNFYPCEETSVDDLFVTEKYLPAPGGEKFVNDGMLMLQDCTMLVSHSEFISRWRFNLKNNSTFHGR